MKDAVKPVEAPRPLELLAPARDADVARAAILHGADAVYIGPESFGARAAAGNSVDDIRELCEFAHIYRAKVYVTVNTIVTDREIPVAVSLIERLYRAGVDAVIVQDMGLLNVDLPPIELHASTQCDTRTPEKARFLEEVGFSQIVLARELTLAEIRAIHSQVKVPLEVFVHGALCVSYSGRCHASQALCGRSANRGECAQICRLPYTLTDASGVVLARDKHLLSLHDFNASALLKDLAAAGASSFKIEGRLKDAAYVKNITAYYRVLLDAVIAEEPDKYCRASCGRVSHTFTPNPYKSFNRGFTSYFLQDRRPSRLASLLTPKSLGEPLKSLADVRNGDGLSFFTRRGEYAGFMVNGISHGMPVPNKPVQIPKGTAFFRTTDVAWHKLMSRSDTASRLIGLDVVLYDNRIEACDERGCRVVLPHALPMEEARNPMDLRGQFDRFGGTSYYLRDFKAAIGDNMFIPASALSSLRREMIAAIDANAAAIYAHSYRRKENTNARYPQSCLDYRDNVANAKAKEFYKRHGVTEIEPAMEVTPGKQAAGTVLMTSRHCVLRELGICLREARAAGKRLPELPLKMKGASREMYLKFDCKRCEMQVTL